MADLSIKTKTAAGQDAGEVDLDAGVFGLEPNVAVMHQVVTAQLAARRAGTQSTKTRAEVRGGGAKPYRQKGTGNARQGSIRAPHYTGGGVALGPKPRKYDQKTPKKMVRLATRSALSDRAAEGKVVVVDTWGFDSPKTKLAKQALDSLSVDGNVLVVISHDDTNALLSFRNLPNVQVIDAGELNAYDVLCSDWVVFTEASLPSAAAADDTRAAPANVASDKKVTTNTSIVPDSDSDSDGDGDGSGSSSTANAGIASTAAGNDADAPYGPGSHAPLADENAQPDGFPIKGNADSMLYHTTESPFYDRTIAEVWFATEASAEAAGFSLPDSLKDQTEVAD